MPAGRPGLPVRYAFPEYRPSDHKTSRRIITLLFILGTLFLLDIMTTQIILHLGGIELNPFMAGIVTHPALHLIIKTAILLVIFPVSLIAEQRVKGAGVFFYGVLITLYIVVLINNLAVILPRIPV